MAAKNCGRVSNDVIIDTDPIPSTSSDESSLSIDDVTISRLEMKISSLRSPIGTSNKEDWMIIGLQKLNELLYTLVCFECHNSGCIQVFFLKSIRAKVLLNSSIFIALGVTF